ncbi:hypothetical protein [Streptomyces coelicoflavus]|uniref:hypothetical protein n=1 Tax=Streptomyces coelicoflavus TaxID=285562 RepID=UPI003F4A56DC
MITLHVRGMWVLAAVGVLSLSACGQSGSGSSDGREDAGVTRAGGGPSAAAGGALTVPEDAEPETKNHYLMQNAIAVCMKERGFVYTPVAGVEPSEESDDGEGKDYALAKKYRQKYGFGIHSSVVYPNDPAVVVPEEKTDPNDTYRSSLPAAQQKAYDKALGELKAIYDKDTPQRPPKDGCVAKAELKVLGPVKSKAEQERENAEQQERDRQAGQALNGDPRLVSLAQEYAACLREEGITVTTTQPTGIGDMVKFQVGAQIPSDAEEPDADEARTLLTREIDLALKDLDCGKEFRAAYWPKYEKNPYVGNNG